MSLPFDVLVLVGKTMLLQLLGFHDVGVRDRLTVVADGDYEPLVDAVLDHRPREVGRDRRQPVHLVLRVVGLALRDVRRLGLRAYVVLGVAVGAAPIAPTGPE